MTGDMTARIVAALIIQRGSLFAVLQWEKINTVDWNRVPDRYMFMNIENRRFIFQEMWEARNKLNEENRQGKKGEFDVFQRNAILVSAPNLQHWLRQWEIDWNIGTTSQLLISETW